MVCAAEDFLTPESLRDMAAGISCQRAAPWPRPSQPGDTVWLGAADSDGVSVSFIQSLYWELGSGLVLPGTGITWQNRGTSLSLSPCDINALIPGPLPFHTIQPSVAGASVGPCAAAGDGSRASWPEGVYWQFGAGLVRPGTGVAWKNGGTRFSLSPGYINALMAERLTIHTIQPAMAETGDGRLRAYGTMCGEWQPRTQAIV